MKLLFTTLIASTTLITSYAMADQSISNTPINTEVTTELNNIFGTTQLENLQVLELENSEMKDTKGAFVPFIPVAIAVGTRFVTNQFVSHQIRNGMLAYSTYSAANNMNKNNN